MARGLGGANGVGLVCWLRLTRTGTNGVLVADVRIALEQEGCPVETVAALLDVQGGRTCAVAWVMLVVNAMTCGGRGRGRAVAAVAVAVAVVVAVAAAQFAVLPRARAGGASVISQRPPFFCSMMYWTKPRARTTKSRCCCSMQQNGLPCALTTIRRCCCSMQHNGGALCRCCREPPVAYG